MSLASDLLSVLGRVRSDFASQVNSGLLVTLDDHIAQIAAVVEHDVVAAEERAKGVLGALYGALHGAPAAEAPAVPAVAPSVSAPTAGVPVEAVAVSPAPDATQTAVSPAFDVVEAPAAETAEAGAEQAPAS